MMLRTLSVLALAAASTMSAQIVGVGTFIHVVKDLDKTIQFYGTGLGLETRNPGAPPAFSPNALVEDLYDAKGSQSRVAVFKVPNSPLGLEFVEFKGISQTPVHLWIQSPGASTLVLSVRDVDAVMGRLRQQGFDSPTGSDLVQDPDGFYVGLTKSNTPGAKLSLTVDNLDQTLRLFHDLLGFQPDKPVGSSRGRNSKAKVPGTAFEVKFNEFKGVERQSLSPSIHDPGAGVLRLMTPEARPPA
jgi:catechol 2,3-dioxygenase-like lactoylglutathione lyase family enzyme